MVRLFVVSERRIQLKLFVIIECSLGHMLFDFVAIKGSICVCNKTKRSIEKEIEFEIRGNTQHRV